MNWRAALARYRRKSGIRRLIALCRRLGLLPGDIRHKALTGLDTSKGRWLEIGPLNRPLVPRDPGRVFYADHCSTAELREKYRGNPDVPSEDIKAVDFDLSRTSLSETAKSGRFEGVVASHVIEHVPDLVGWLRDVARILDAGGTLALVVPDKRYTFDVLRRESSPWMIDDAVGNTRPSIEIVIDHFMNNVTANTRKLWKSPESRHELKRAVAPSVCPELRQRHAAGEYIDAHCWVFTPRHFEMLIRDTIDRYDIPLDLTFLEETHRGQLEFYAQLTRRS